MQDALGRANGHHEIGLDERAVDAERDVAGCADVHEPGVLRVVDLDLAVEAAGEGVGDDAEALELSRDRPAHQAAGHEQCLALGRDSGVG